MRAAALTRSSSLENRQLRTAVHVPIDGLPAQGASEAGSGFSEELMAQFLASARQVAREEEARLARRLAEAEAAAAQRLAAIAAALHAETDDGRYDMTMLIGACFW